MSKPLATAFQSLNKKLAYETRVYTLGLYRSLLRSSEQYRQNSIKQEVREKFKKNKHNTSRSQVLCLLQEADKTLDYLNRGIAGEKDVRAKINEYVQKYNLDKKNKPMSQPLGEKKKPKMTKRKPYQTVMTTRTSSGYEFKRIRGWRQPVKTSMMLKNRVKTIQGRLDRYSMFKSQLGMIQSERLFLEQLGCLPQDKLKGYETTIKIGLEENNKFNLQKSQLEDK